jgi:hypothetical protein
LPNDPEGSQSRKLPDRSRALLWHRNPIFDELYRSYTKRISGGRDVKYELTDAALFVLAAATSGIIGNFAYAAVVAAVRHLRSKSDDKLAQTFEQVVELGGYDSIRIRIHGEITPKLEIDATHQGKLRTIADDFEVDEA